MTCLYNGKGLPDINAVYTKVLQVQYPHAVISHNIYWIAVAPDDYILYISNQQVFTYESAEDRLAIRFPVGTYKCYRYYPTQGITEWTEQTADNDKYINDFFETVWCNKDILNTDGSVYLAASDPVPVTSAMDIDPKAMLMGHRLGSIIHAQRRKKT